MQITDDWDDRYRNGTTAWEDGETAPATKELVLRNVRQAQSILEIGCGRGMDSVWLAEQGYRVVACDVSPTAIAQAEARAREHGVYIDFHVADVLHDHTALPSCYLVFERGVLHTYITDEGRAIFARTIADLLNPGQIWLSLAGAAATPEESEEATKRREPRVSASQIANAVESYFDILSMIRTRYGFAGIRTDFPALLPFSGGGSSGRRHVAPKGPDLRIRVLPFPLGEEDPAHLPHWHRAFPWIEPDDALGTPGPVVALLTVEHCLAVRILKDEVGLHQRATVLLVMGCAPITEVEQDWVESVEVNIAWIPAGIEVVRNHLRGHKASIEPDAPASGSSQRIQAGA